MASEEDRNTIRRAQKHYQSTVEQMYEDMIFELSERFHLDEDVVRKILDEEF